MFLKPFIIYQTVHAFISQRKFRLIVQELGVQNFMNNLIVEVVHKTLYYDPNICALIFTCNRFCNFINIFIKSFSFWDIFQVWLRNDWLLLYSRRFQSIKSLKTYMLYYIWCKVIWNTKIKGIFATFLQ